MPRLALFAYLPLWSLIFFGGFLVYGASGHDDPHINFWFAHTLLERGELVNYNGDRINQATNLLLALLTALFTSILPFSLVTNGYLVDLYAGFACCALVTWLARISCPLLAIWPAFITLGSVSFLVWTFGGMGSVLAALCLLTTIISWWRFIQSSKPSVIHCLLNIASTLALYFARPEMPLVVPAVNLYVLLFYWLYPEKRIRCIKLLFLSFFACLVFFCIQKSYFSSWFPPAVLAKQPQEILSRAYAGTQYSIIHAIMNPALGIALLMSTPTALHIFWKNYFNITEHKAVSKNESSDNYCLIILLLATLQVYAGFIWASGGDWMQCGRFFVPIIPISALLLTILLHTLAPKPIVAHVLLALIAALGFRIQPLFFTDNGTGAPAWLSYRMQHHHNYYSNFEQYNYEHLRDMAVIDHLHEITPIIHKELGRPVRVTSGQAGMIFYYLAGKFPEKLHFTDMRGLVDDSLIRCPLLISQPHNLAGIEWEGFTEYFKILPELEKNCAVLPPDILFDLDGIYKDSMDAFSNAGYTLIHQEKGSLVSNDRWLPSGFSAPLLNFVFVRNELLPLLPAYYERTINYDDVSLHQRWGYHLFRSEYFAARHSTTQQ